MMKKLLVVPIVIAAALPVAAQQPQKQQPAPQTQQASIPDPLPPLSVPAGYKYDARGRRDPFVNPIPKPVPEEAAAPVVARPPGLKGLSIADAKLVGVVTSKDLAMNKVIIQAAGNKTYFAGRGDTLWDGVIKDIQADAVVFTQVTPARPAGQPANAPQPTREIVRKLHPTTGENK
jgi:Tfp pilus assembly protein PilP